MHKKLPLHGIAHITGGGLYENVPRILPPDTDVFFDSKIMPVPPIFRLIVESGNVSKEEAYRVFNMGIGMVWFVPAKFADDTVKIAKSTGFNAAVIGEVKKGSGKVIVQ